MSRRLHLVRHGRSTWNEQGLVQGQTAAPELTERGREQAHAAAAQLAGVDATLLLTSDLTRAAQTADIIGAALGLTPVPTPALREMHLGEWQGLTTQQAGIRWGEWFGRDPWTEQGGQSRRRVPGGESIDDVGTRMAGLLSSPEICSAGGDVVLVGHGDTIRVALSLLDRRALHDMEWIPVDNGQVISRAAPDPAGSIGSRPGSGTR
ncbi:histidine phosphatase family protein [Nakamurella sp. YIM 132087]|uniref:Histidine phosphatase family protein n=1 Tax=Nakamurella alba TaxID=2665158 RepID=A0A7K1FG41_9ACTN|nr:histidine phosphatase family protein [Nakamurella alba]MTD13068.1 histidine phosphatase family protein [Nakamurella alba]